MSRETVWLVGMMGSGKSAVGPLLAQRLGVRFVDTDAEVERAAGVGIAAQFDTDGEAAFRARERAAIEAVAGQAAVVALGGGAIAQPGAAERLAASGDLVYLRARPETLAARVGDGPERPLLRGLGPAERRERLAKLLAEREVHYSAAAWTVDTDECSPAEVARWIGDHLAGSRT